MKDKVSRKRQVGKVVSNKMDKTVVVAIERIVQDRVYKKYVRRRGKCVAHDDQNLCGIGDKVLVVETRPVSKTKRWRLVEIVKRAE